MPYTREELFRELKIEPVAKEKTPGEGMLLRVLHERAGVFADEYRKRPYIQKLRKTFGKEFNTKLAKTVEKVFAKMRKNKEWAFLFYFWTMIVLRQLRFTYRWLGPRGR